MNNLFFYLGIVLLCASCTSTSQVTESSNYHFQETFEENKQRPWIGAAYWSNPLQDWQLRDGRVENIRSGGDRNVHSLTHDLNDSFEPFKISVDLGSLNASPDTAGWMGFKLGARGRNNDFRAHAVYGQGLEVGITFDNKLFIGSVDENAQPLTIDQSNMKLVVEGTPKNNSYHLKLSLFEERIEKATIHLEDVAPELLKGNLALVCSAVNPLQLEAGETLPTNFSALNALNRRRTPRTGNTDCWFDNWTFEGKKVSFHPERTFGPILFAQYSLDKNILKLTAQLAPIAPNEDQTVSLFFFENNTWTLKSTVPIESLSRTASFRLDNFEALTDTPYQVRFEHSIYEGIIRHEPLEKEELVLAALSCNLDSNFPNTEIVNGVKHFNPDVITFLGDQIYEPNGGFGNEPYAETPIVALDYLRKWYLFGWSFRDVFRDIPSIMLPDDHDVYHGNIWGDGGIATPEGLVGANAQDAGGYKLPPILVNMVQRTQTSHMPDPYDPTPVAQGITVHYGDMNYAGLSIAFIEDRKWKSPPKKFLPNAKIWNGWAQNPEFNARNDSFVEGAHLLGERQLTFLEDWSRDWSDGVWMKTMVSGTILSNLATLPNGSTSDANVPSLKVFGDTEYPPNDQIMSDFDSNAWPQQERNESIEKLRKAFALHIAGDQHLGSTLQYGINDWQDGNFAICVPAVANIWPRRWMPQEKGKNQLPNAPRYTGDYVDGFGNLITVYAAGNPRKMNLGDPLIYDRAPGYGIIKFSKTTRNITMENWPLWENPALETAKPFIGWPLTVNQLENFGNRGNFELPTLKTNIPNPVVQIIDETTQEIVFTLRINGTAFQPKVPAGKYTIKIGEPDKNMWQSISGILATSNNQTELKIEF